MRLIITTISITLCLTANAFADPGFAIAVGNLILATAGITVSSIPLIAVVGYANISNKAIGIKDLLKQKGASK